MDIKVKGVRKKCRVLWIVKPLNHSGPILRFWRTGRHNITREEIIKAAGLDIYKIGTVISRIDF